MVASRSDDFTTQARKPPPCSSALTMANIRTSPPPERRVRHARQARRATAGPPAVAVRVRRAVCGRTGRRTGRGRRRVRFGKRPRAETRGIKRCDALDLTAADIGDAMVVTNPPYAADALYPLIRHFVSIASTCWLLLPAAFKENTGTVDLLAHLRTYRPIGRQVWIAGTTMAGKVDHGWYEFSRERGDTYDGFPRLHRQGRLSLE